MIASNKIRQIRYDLRHQSVVTWVTLVGTALSVFLLMTVISLEQLNTMPFAPKATDPACCMGRIFIYQV